MSTPIGTLWTVERQPGGRRIRAVAAYAGLSLHIPTDYKHFEDNKKPEFIAKFASGKIPAFEGKDGFCLFEGSAIARYVASLAPNSTLLGNSIKDAALIDQWVSFMDTEIGANISNIFQMLEGFLPQYIKPNHTAYSDRAIRSYGTLEKHLSTRTFLVGERITLADISAASVLRSAFLIHFDAELRKSHPNIVRFYETVVNQPAIKPIFGETEYVEKARQFVPKPKEKKETKPAEPAAPKAEKKPKKKEAEDDDDDGNLVPEEPKPKNPLDNLPKSDFNLEDWKRAYSNMDTRGPGGSLEWFYNKFDKEGFSIWRVDFKYNEELTQVFMSSNQIGGFFNRLEASRKYLFGSVGVLGTANNSVITGTLILRGQDHKAVVDVAPDWESYTFRKLDLSNSADKAFFEAALAWDLEENGKKWADGKNFK